MVLMMFLMFGLVGVVSANDGFGVFANSNTNNIQFIDPETNETTGPWLAGQLGSYGGGLFDVAITPDGKTAVVSNFGDSKIFFIDISGGFNAAPVLLTPKGVRIGFFAEDMVITPDGKYVLVTDGGFSARVAVISIYDNGIIAPYLLKNNNLGTRYANAVDITPDGKTVLVADYFSGRAYSYALQNDGTLVYINTAWVLPFRPVNVTISPDGQTAIMAIAGSSALVALAIDETGLIYKTTHIAMPFKNGQSCVFNQAGTKAYYLSNSQNGGTKVVVLNVNGPGDVSTTGTNITVRPRRGTSQLFGVDNIALDPTGNYLYVTNPTLSGGVAGISVLDLTSNAQVDSISVNGIPTGIAFTTIEE